MKIRPLSITILGWIFIAAGIIGIAYHAAEVKDWRALENEGIWVFCIRLLALICGIFLLRGSNWARWLLVVWIGYHLVLSAFHSPLEVVVHGMPFVAAIYFLFRPKASLYFRAMEPPPSISKSDYGNSKL